MDEEYTGISSVPLQCLLADGVAASYRPETTAPCAFALGEKVPSYSLADNGEPTETHALLPGSVAIDVIPADMCEVDEDQRGEARPGGTMCDAGAFEVQP